MYYFRGRSAFIAALVMGLIYFFRMMMKTSPNFDGLDLLLVGSFIAFGIISIRSLYIWRRYENSLIQRFNDSL